MFRVCQSCVFTRSYGLKHFVGQTKGKLFGKIDVPCIGDPRSRGEQG